MAVLLGEEWGHIGGQFFAKTQNVIVSISTLTYFMFTPSPKCTRPLWLHVYFKKNYLNLFKNCKLILDFVKYDFFIIKNENMGSALELDPVHVLDFIFILVLLSLLHFIK